MSFWTLTKPYWRLIGQRYFQFSQQTWPENKEEIGARLLRLARSDALMFCLVDEGCCGMITLTADRKTLRLFQTCKARVHVNSRREIYKCDNKAVFEEFLIARDQDFTIKVRDEWLKCFEKLTVDVSLANIVQSSNSPLRNHLVFYLQILSSWYTQTKSQHLLRCITCPVLKSQNKTDVIYLCYVHHLQLTTVSQCIAKNEDLKIKYRCCWTDVNPKTDKKEPTASVSIANTLRVKNKG